MECDINRDGGLVIKCASVAEENGLLAWLAASSVPNVHLPDSSGQVRKVSVIDADRIHVRLGVE